MASSLFQAFGRAELERFLESIDRHLVRKQRIEVIGGGAVALRYSSRVATSDIDTFQSMTPALGKAASQARKETGLEIPMADSPVADLPWDYEKRVERVLPRLQRLEVFTLERHDLALSARRTTR